MTNEQAIKELQGHKGIIIYPSERMDVALDMAISALNSLEEVYAKGYNDGFTQAEVNFENDKALSQEPKMGKCRTCKHGECYNDEWCRCTHYKISGCRVLINNGCEVENCYGIKEPYNDGRE